MDKSEVNVNNGMFYRHVSSDKLVFANIQTIYLIRSVADRRKDYVNPPRYP